MDYGYKVPVYLGENEFSMVWKRMNLVVAEGGRRKMVLVGSELQLR